MGLRLEQIERLGENGFYRIVRACVGELRDDLEVRLLAGERTADWLIGVGTQVLDAMNASLDVADMEADDCPEIPRERMRGAASSGITLGLLAVGYGIAVEEIMGGGDDGLADTEHRA